MILPRLGICRTLSALVVSTIFVASVVSAATYQSWPQFQYDENHAGGPVYPIKALGSGRIDTAGFEKKDPSCTGGQGSPSAWAEDVGGGNGFREFVAWPQTDCNPPDVSVPIEYGVAIWSKTRVPLESAGEHVWLPQETYA